MKFLSNLAHSIDYINEQIGRATAWVAVSMVLVQFIVVVMRYVFGIGSIMMQESVTYMHAFLFLVGSGYTLLHGGHVRVDVFYRKAKPFTRALVNLFGTVFLLLPVCILIFWFTWPYVIQSWNVLEGSKETSGIHAIYLLKTTILLFSCLVGLQGLAIILHSFLILSGVKKES